MTDMTMSVYIFCIRFFIFVVILLIIHCPNTNTTNHTLYKNSHTHTIGHYLRISESIAADMFRGEEHRQCCVNEAIVLASSQGMCVVCMILCVCMCVKCDVC